MTSTRNRAAAGIGVIALFAAGCGDSSTALSPGAAGTLHQDVRALTQSLANHKWNDADHALAQLRTDLTSAIDAGDVTTTRALAIKSDVAAIAADLAAHRKATPPLPLITSSSSSSPTPKPAGPPKPEKSPKPKPPHDHGHGKGHGEGGD